MAIVSRLSDCISWGFVALNRGSLKVGLTVQWFLGERIQVHPIAECKNEETTISVYSAVKCHLVTSSLFSRRFTSKNRLTSVISVFYWCLFYIYTTTRSILKKLSKKRNFQFPLRVQFKIYWSFFVTACVGVKVVSRVSWFLLGHFMVWFRACGKPPLNEFTFQGGRQLYHERLYLVRQWHSCEIPWSASFRLKLLIRWIWIDCFVAIYWDVGPSRAPVWRYYRSTWIRQ